MRAYGGKVSNRLEIPRRGMDSERQQSPRLPCRGADCGICSYPCLSMGARPLARHRFWSKDNQVEVLCTW